MFLIQYLTNKTAAYIVAGIIAFFIAMSLKKKKKDDYKEELNKVLNSDESKVKSQWN